MRKLLFAVILAGLFMPCTAPRSNALTMMDASPIKRTFTNTQKLQAIIWIESRDGANRYNKHEPQAAGLLQQWPILVHDVNRILGYKKYQVSDRENDKKAIEMFWIYQKYYNPSLDFEVMARIWCGGPDGMTQTCTLPYLKLALNQLNSL